MASSDVSFTEFLANVTVDNNLGEKIKAMQHNASDLDEEGFASAPSRRRTMGAATSGSNLRSERGLSTSGPAPTSSAVVPSPISTAVPAASTEDDEGSADDQEDDGPVSEAELDHEGAPEEDPVMSKKNGFLYNRGHSSDESSDEEGEETIREEEDSDDDDVRMTGSFMERPSKEPEEPVETDKTLAGKRKRQGEDQGKPSSAPPILDPKQALRHAAYVLEVQDLIEDAADPESWYNGVMLVQKLTPLSQRGRDRKVKEDVHHPAEIRMKYVLPRETVNYGTGEKQSAGMLRGRLVAHEKFLKVDGAVVEMVDRSVTGVMGALVKEYHDTKKKQLWRRQTTMDLKVFLCASNSPGDFKLKGEGFDLGPAAQLGRTLKEQAEGGKNARKGGGRGRRGGGRGRGGRGKPKARTRDTELSGYANGPSPSEAPGQNTPREDTGAKLGSVSLNTEVSGPNPMKRRKGLAEVPTEDLGVPESEVSDAMRHFLDLMEEVRTKNQELMSRSRAAESQRDELKLEQTKLREEAAKVRSALEEQWEKSTQAAELEHRQEVEKHEQRAAALVKKQSDLLFLLEESQGKLTTMTKELEDFKRNQPALVERQEDTPEREGKDSSLRDSGEQSVEELTAQLKAELETELTPKLVAQLTKKIENEVRQECERELSVLQGKLAAAETAISQKKSQKGALCNQEAEATREEVEGLQAQASELEQKVAVLRASARQERKNLRKLAGEIDTNTEELEEVTEKVETLKQDAVAKNAKVKKLKEQQATLTDEVEQLSRERDGLQKEVKELSARKECISEVQQTNERKVVELRVEISQLLERRKTLEQEVDNMADRASLERSKSPQTPSGGRGYDQKRQGERAEGRVPVDRTDSGVGGRAKTGWDQTEPQENFRGGYRGSVPWPKKSHRGRGRGGSRGGRGGRGGGNRGSYTTQNYQPQGQRESDQESGSGQSYQPDPRHVHPPRQSYDPEYRNRLAGSPSSPASSPGYRRVVSQLSVGDQSGPAISKAERTQLRHAREQRERTERAMVREQAEHQERERRRGKWAPSERGPDATGTDERPHTFSQFEEEGLDGLEELRDETGIDDAVFANAMKNAEVEEGDDGMAEVV